MAIPGSANPLLLASAAEAAAVAGYEIERSLRFNSADSAYLSRTPASAGNRKTWTWAGWVKRCKLGSLQYFFACVPDTSNYFQFGFDANDEIRVHLIYIPGADSDNYTSAVFRDTSAWYHIVLNVDTTQATASNRMKLWVNGVEQTFSTDGRANITQNYDYRVNATVQHSISSQQPYDNAGQLNGYLADIHFIDGQALDPTSFGKFDTNGIWQPIEYTGSFGPRYSGETWSSASAADSYAFDGSTAYNSSAVRLYGTSTYHKIVDASTPFTDVTSVVVGTSENVGSIKLDGTVYTTTYASGVGLTVDSPPSSFSDIEVLGASNGVQIAYVRVNGELLINSGVISGNNSFYLPFSDNSTAAALGTDTSGNSNTWTVNNISVEQGNGSYVSGWSGTLASGYPGSNAFDGNTATYSIADASASATWTAPSAISFTTLRIFGMHDNGTISVNGTNVTSQFSSTPGSWVTLTGISSPLSTVVLTSSGSSQPRISAIEIDGVVLIDYSAGAGNDSLVDVPTNGTETDTGVGGEVRGNYCTLNPLFKTGTGTPAYSNGNLDFSAGVSGDSYFAGTFLFSTGKYYYEATINAVGGGVLIGVCRESNSTIVTNIGSYRNDGTIYNLDTTTQTFGSAYTAGDVIGVAIDCDNGEVQFYKNGVGQGATPSFTFTAGTSLIVRGRSNNPGASLTFNFGQRPFAYTAPSGFKALCTANLDAPVVTKPSEYMDVKLYTGNGSTQTISGLEFSPDFVWIKRRDTTQDHNLYDSVRGSSGGYIKQLLSNLTSAESPYGDGVYGGVTALNSDGFSLGSSNSDYRLTNASSSPYVAWTWDAGTTTVSNTDGSITSSVRANASAGFSIVTYTGTGAAATVGHGLGVAPSLLIVKQRNAVRGWPVYHKDIGASYYLQLERTDAKGGPYSGLWNDTAPTSSVFSILNDGGSNVSGGTYVGYCFAPVAGYSAMGSYTGNGSTDGPFVYTGFRPRWILMKASSSSTDWWIYDSARDAYNVAGEVIYPNSSSAASTSLTYTALDILSNGFKLRMSTTPLNTNGVTYIYAAFAESPFQYARAR